ncbi:MAG: tetratricopeptide repeat protein [Myxococcota bacterium]|jgi:tetratricopeptide (TPR) repeat protein|nr:tetratricopeptide repeat protein [Myxococcota bacterium]
MGTRAPWVLAALLFGCGDAPGAPPAEPAPVQPVATEAEAPVAEVGAVADTPTGADRLLLEAEALVALGRAEGDPARFEEAERQLRTALELYPEDERAYIALGLLHSPTEGLLAEAGDPLLTIEMFEQAIRLDPSNQTAYLALYERVIERRPADSRAHSRLARGYLRLGQHDRAGSLARKAVKLAQTANDVYAMQEARTTLGQVYLGQDRYDLAEAIFGRTVAHPDGTRLGCAYQGLGELYTDLAARDPLAAGEIAAMGDAGEAFEAALAAYERGERGSARALAERAEELRPRRSQRVFLALLMLFEQRYDPARAVFEAEAVAIDEDPGPAVGLAHLAIAERDHGAAEQRLRDVVERWTTERLEGSAEPDYHRVAVGLAHLGLGWVAANRNQHRDAVGRFDRALAGNPDDLLGLLGKANSLIGLGRLDEADALLERVLELDPGNPYALAESAVIRYGLGDDRGAEQRFEAALERGTAYTCPYEGLGLVYLRQGRVDEARDQLERAVDLNPDIEYKKFNALARIYIDEGRLDDAEALLNASIENFPDDPEARTLLDSLRERRGVAP